VSEIDYPKDLLQIQVLDDSTDDTRALTSRAWRIAEPRVQCRADPPDGAHGLQSGALETGLASADSEFVCILDADFVPNRTCSRRRSISSPIRKSA